MEWIPAQVPAAAAELERAGFPPWLAAPLARRGVSDSGSAERFLNPTLEQLHDPFLLAGMEEGVERLLRARAGAAARWPWGSATACTSWSTGRTP